jgi:hypothetical protein
MWPSLFRPLMRVFFSSSDFSGSAPGVSSSRVRYVWYRRDGDVGVSFLMPIILFTH